MTVKKDRIEAIIAEGSIFYHSDGTEGSKARFYYDY